MCYFLVQNEGEFFWNFSKNLLHYSYLHSKDITHGYVTADTVFIQHDGLIKLGSSELIDWIAGFISLGEIVGETSSPS